MSYLEISFGLCAHAHAACFRILLLINGFKLDYSFRNSLDLCKFGSLIVGGTARFASPSHFYNKWPTRLKPSNQT
jgi:hypothetical protein